MDEWIVSIVLSVLFTMCFSKLVIVTPYLLGKHHKDPTDREGATFEVRGFGPDPCHLIQLHFDQPKTKVTALYCNLTFQPGTWAKHFRENSSFILLIGQILN